MAFSVTDFKSKGIKRGGARSALFAVELHYPSFLASPQSNFLIKGASIPASTVGSYDVFYQGKAIKIGGDRNFDTWETTIINDEDFAIRKVLEKWIDLISDPKLNTRDKETFDTSEGDSAKYKKDLKVIQYGKRGQELRTYEFIGAWPSALSTINLDWATASEIEEFTCTWVYDSWHTKDGANAPAFAGPPFLP